MSEHRKTSGDSGSWGYITASVSFGLTTFALVLQRRIAE